MSEIDKNFEDLRETVERESGVHKTTMEILREAYGAGRLGKLVCDSISTKLAENGLRHLPNPLPQNQYEEVRLLSARQLGRAMDAFFSPSNDGDKLLREIGSSDASETLQRIRELVCN